MTLDQLKELKELSDKLGINEISELESLMAQFNTKDPLEAVKKKLEINSPSYGKYVQKPEGNKRDSYVRAVRIANANNKPVIYGYTNNRLDSKFFEVTPIICDDEIKGSADFRKRYKNCGTIYTAYPGERVKEDMQEFEDDTLEDEVFDMPIEALISEDDDFEDYAFCDFCGEYFPKSDLRLEKDMGYLCDRCVRAIESREGNVLDFDEEFDDFEEDDFED